MLLPMLPSTISPREVDVLTGVVCGRTNEEIAAWLTISPRTVQTHVRNLMAKTDTRNRTHLAVTAIVLGLVPIPRLTALE